MAAAESPDAIVCDISMPGLDGLEARRRLVAHNPEIKVVMLSMHADVAHVKAAFQAGARGYLTKSCAPDELLPALHEVLRGGWYLSPSVSSMQLASLRRNGRPPSEARSVVQNKTRTGPSSSYVVVVALSQSGSTRGLVAT